MLFQKEYLMVWGVYTLAVLGIMLVWWGMTRPIPWRWIKQPLRLMPMALMLVPAPVAADRIELAPALFIFLFDTFLVKGASADRAVLYLVYGLGLGVIVILIDALLHILFGTPKRNKLS